MNRGRHERARSGSEGHSAFGYEHAHALVSHTTEQSARWRVALSQVSTGLELYNCAEEKALGCALHLLPLILNRYPRARNPSPRPSGRLPEAPTRHRCVHVLEAHHEDLGCHETELGTMYVPIGRCMHSLSWSNVDVQDAIGNHNA